MPAATDPLLRLDDVSLAFGSVPLLQHASLQVEPGERVCIDRHPDYPAGTGDAYACRYEQERVTTRVCRKSAGVRSPSLPESATPACWLDTDCRSQSCDRGACRCTGDEACEDGRCARGLCTRSGS